MWIVFERDPSAMLIVTALKSLAMRVRIAVHRNNADNVIAIIAVTMSAILTAVRAAVDMQHHAALERVVMPRANPHVAHQAVGVDADHAAINLLSNPQARPVAVLLMQAVIRFPLIKNQVLRTKENITSPPSSI